MHIFSPHQEKQIEVINSLEQQVRNNAMEFSTVTSVEDYTSDTRICLTSVHLPHQQFITKVQNFLINPLQKLLPGSFFYPSDSLHLTIKNVRVINDPPRFMKEDVKKAEKVFAAIVPRYAKFNIYFYRLMLFPNNLALIGTTDPELDSLILALDKELKKAGVPDDKKYMNSQYFFSNMTLARFSDVPSKAFVQKVEALSKAIAFEPYLVDAITLVTGTAVFTKKKIINTWKLKERMTSIS